MKRKFEHAFSMMFVLVAMVGVMFMASCKKDDPEPEPTPNPQKSNVDSKLVGTWTYTDYDDNGYSIETITLKSNGSGTYSYKEYYNGKLSDSDTETFEWSTINNNTLIIIFEDEVETFTYIVSGKTIIMTDDEGDTTTWTKS